MKLATPVNIILALSWCHQFVSLLQLAGRALSQLGNVPILKGESKCPLTSLHSFQLVEHQRESEELFCLAK